MPVTKLVSPDTNEIAVILSLVHYARGMHQKFSYTLTKALFLQLLVLSWNVIKLAHTINGQFA